LQALISSYLIEIEVPPDAPTKELERGKRRVDQEHMPVDEKTANELESIKAIRRADKTAFKALCEIYYDALYRFLWRKTRDEEAAKDLAQELFLNVWKNRANLDETQSCKPYLYRAANNLAINHLKKKAVRQAHISESAAAGQTAALDEQRDFQEYVDEVLIDLPEEQRLVFTLNKFEGLKYGEIAGMLNISVKTVESRMSKALKALREKVGALLSLAVFFNLFIS
jgi:RNA polymerase sigma-70 factor (ECF subfamily)